MIYTNQYIYNTTLFFLLLFFLYNFNILDILDNNQFKPNTLFIYIYIWWCQEMNQLQARPWGPSRARIAKMSYICYSSLKSSSIKVFGQAWYVNYSFWMIPRPCKLRTSSALIAQNARIKVLCHKPFPTTVMKNKSKAYNFHRSYGS